MEAERSGLGIIFHSGSYDRIQHGMAIGLAALALGREVKLFFTYWALEYLKKEGAPSAEDGKGQEDSAHKQILVDKVREGHMEPFSELVSQARALGGKFYTCTNSMSILNIARNELIEAVERPMGLTTFLRETAQDQVIFV